MTNSYYAYIHCRPDGSPFYVGKGDVRRVKDVYRRNRHHENIVNKYGVKNILVGKLECSTEAIAFALEKGLIKCLRRMGVGLANKTDGGEGSSGAVVSEATRAKLSAAGLSQEAREKRKQTRLASGWRPTPEMKAKLSAAHKGKKKTPEHCARIGDAHRGKTLSPEQRANISAAQRGRKQSPETIEKRISKIRGRSIAPDILERRALSIKAGHKRARDARLASLPAGKETLCTTCNEPKMISEMGTGAWHNTCRKCRNRKQQIYRQKRKAASESP